MRGAGRADEQVLEQVVAHEHVGGHDAQAARGVEREVLLRERLDELALGLRERAARSGVLGTGDKGEQGCDGEGSEHGGGAA